MFRQILLLLHAYRQLLLLSIGFLIPFVLSDLRKSRSRWKSLFSKGDFFKNLSTITANTIIVVGGLVLSLYAIGLSEGIISMSASDKAQFVMWLNAYINLVYIFAGIMAGSIILWIYQTFIESKKHKNTDVGEINADFRKRIEKNRRKMEKRINKKRNNDNDYKK